MRAGPLDRRIVIEQRSLTKNSAGGVTESWSTFATVWAQKMDLRGEEFQAATRENARTITEWRIRYISGLKSEMRISCNGQYYNITGIAETGRRDGKIITTELRIE